MANKLGGYLLIGVREDNEAPVEIVGIEQADVAVEKILSSAWAGISERIYGLDARSIPLAKGSKPSVAAGRNSLYIYVLALTTHSRIAGIVGDESQFTTFH